MRHRALLAALAVVLTACGGSSNVGQRYDAAASHATLAKAGWTVKPGRGMTPISGGKQLGWLDAVSPAGVKVSMQFLESPKKATDELAAIHNGVAGVKADLAFTGQTIGNVLVFATPNGHQKLPASVVTRLGALVATAKHAAGAY